MASSSSSSSRYRYQDWDGVDLQQRENAYLEAQQKQSVLLGRIPPLSSYQRSVRQRFRPVLTAPQAHIGFPANIPPPPPLPLPPQPPQPPNIGFHVDLEVANIPQPVPNPIEADHIVFLVPVPNHNLVDRIRIFIAGLFTRGRLLVAGLFTRGRLLVAGLFTRGRLLVAGFFAGFFARVWFLVNRVRVFFEYLAARVRAFFEYVSALPFIRYLVKRNEEFRAEGDPNEMKPRLVSFQSNSSPRNDKLWKFFKWVYIVNVWLMVLSVFAGICYRKFGEASGFNPNSFRFKDEAMVNPVLAVSFLFSVVFGCWAYHRWNETKLFKIRPIHIGFLAFDVICDLRVLKTVGLTCYGFYDVEKKYWVWTDFFVVAFPVFYSIGSLSILILFQQEFYHAHGLINDFIVIFVGPMIIQFAHGSILNGVLYSIPIVFGRLSKLVGYIYRPHVTGEFYDPTRTGN